MQLSPLGRRYAISAPPTLLAAVPTLYRLWTEPMPGYIATPMHYVGLAFIFITIGFLFADFTNPGTALSAWWSRIRRQFDIRFYPAVEVIDGNETNVPSFVLLATKHMSETAIEIVVYEHVQFVVRTAPILINRTGPRDFSKGEQVIVNVAKIARATTSVDYWGDGAMKRGIVRGTGNLVEVRAVRRGKIKQRYAVFISYEEAGQETANRYFYLAEDRHVFAR